MRDWIHERFTEYQGPPQTISRLIRAHLEGVLLELQQLISADGAPSFADSRHLVFLLAQIAWMASCTLNIMFECGIVSPQDKLVLTQQLIAHELQKRSKGYYDEIRQKSRLVFHMSGKLDEESYFFDAAAVLSLLASYPLSSPSTPCVQEQVQQQEQEQEQVQVQEKQQEQEKEHVQQQELLSADIWDKVSYAAAQNGISPAQWAARYFGGEWSSGNHPAMAFEEDHPLWQLPIRHDVWTFPVDHTVWKMNLEFWGLVSVACPSVDDAELWGQLYMLWG